MLLPVKYFWLNLAIGFLGLVLGFSYLIDVLRVISNVKDLVLGILLVIMATGWIVYVLSSKKIGSKSV